MNSKNLLITYISLFFLCIKYKCLYIPSGMNSLNNFLYLSRISKYYNQSKKSSCSLNDGSECYFTANRYIKDILKTRYDKLIGHEWIKLYSEIEDFDYDEVLYHLSNQTSKYKKLFSNEHDKDQHPSDEKLNIIMTFDDETTKSNMYLEELTAIFYNEKLIAKFEGQLRLSDEYKDLSKTPKLPNYPSKLYGVIESDSVSITFEGKLFIFNGIYVRAHDEENKSDKINFFGYVGEQIVYGYSYSDKNRNEKNWIKVLSHTNIPTDKLVISGPYDIDNIEFTFYYETNVEVKDIIEMKNEKRGKLLIYDDEI
mgnify:CR=1 FL=1